MSRFSQMAGTAALLCFQMSLAACAAFDSERAKLQPIRTVAVISAIGDTFTFTDAGLTRLTDDGRVSDISSWDLDPMIAREVGALLGRRFQVRPVTYRRDDFAKRDGRSPIAPVNMFGEDALKGSLRKAKTSQPVDAYVVIVKAEAQTGPSNRLVGGLGAVTFHTVIGSYEEIHALYEIKVVDGHSFEVIESLSAAPIGPMELSRLAGPTRVVDEAAVPRGAEVAQNDTVRRGITELIDQSLEPTLLDMHLIEGRG